MSVISEFLFCLSERTYGKSSYFYNICSNPLHISIRISTQLVSSRSPWPNSDCAKSRAALAFYKSAPSQHRGEKGSEHSVIYFTRLLCFLLIMLQPLHSAFETAVKVLLHICTFFVQEPFWHFHFTHLTSWSATFGDLLNWQFCILKH